MSSLINEDIAWSLILAVHPGNKNINQTHYLHNDSRPGIWLQVNKDGKWNTSGELTADARKLIDHYLPLKLQKDLSIGQAGQSLDGRIATESGHSHYVTGPQDITRLHRLRALVDAVVVGAGTVTADDPRLTVRNVEGTNPVRVVLDPDGRLDRKHQVFSDKSTRTIEVRRSDVNLSHNTQKDNPNLIQLPCGENGFDPKKVIEALRTHGFRRVLIEGGGITLSRFLQAGALDRLHVTVAPILIGSGRAAFQLQPIKSLKDADNQNILICEFKELRDSPPELFMKILNFYNVGKYVNKNPTHADLPKAMFKKNIGNSHFRKGLLDEWKTACTPEQIKWMTNQINPELMEYFSWERGF